MPDDENMLRDRDTEPRVVVSDDKLSARVVIPAGCDPTTLDAELLTALARERGIEITGEIEDTLTRVVREHRADPTGIDRVFVEGRPPEHGRDGRFVWQAEHDPANRTPDLDPSDTKPVDHYEHQNYVLVGEGEWVASVTKPTDGRPGRDVTGRALPATPGRRHPMHIEDSLRVETDGRVITCLHGILVVEEKRVRVTPAFEVAGDVDFSTGNIRFSGSVHVRGGVEDRFLVNATENVIVDGLIGDGVIRAGQNLVARVGMAARERGKIAIEGDAEVGYLLNVTGKVRGSLRFHRELVHCYLTTGADLRGPNGTVMGGALAVSGGVDIGTLGSPAGAPTMLTLGSVPFLDNALRKVLRQIETSEERHRQLKLELYPLTNTDVTLSDGDRTRLGHLRTRIAELDAALAGMHAERRDLEQLAARCAKVDVHIGRVIHPGVTLVAEGRAFRFDRQAKGPLRIGWDADRRLKVRIGSAPLCPIERYAVALRPSAA